MHEDDVSISDVLTKHGDNVLSVTFKAYRRRFISFNNAWRRRFISDVLTMDGQDVVSVTFLQCMDRTFY